MKSSEMQPTKTLIRIENEEKQSRTNRAYQSDKESFYLFSSSFVFAIYQSKNFVRAWCVLFSVENRIRRKVCCVNKIKLDVLERWLFWYVFVLQRKTFEICEDFFFYTFLAIFNFVDFMPLHEWNFLIFLLN